MIEEVLWEPKKKTKVDLFVLISIVEQIANHRKNSVIFESANLLIKLESPE
jgi:hypothetical protein